MVGPAELPHESLAVFRQALERVQALAVQRQEHLSSLPTIADGPSLKNRLTTIPRVLPPEGHELGLERAMQVLFEEVLPTLAQGQAGPRYFGFVTGGTLPSALLTDMVVSMLDSNVQVHLPRETLSTMIEKFALDMVLDVLHLDRSQWSGTFTTGATTSNVLALSCARQATVQRAVRIRRQRRREAGETVVEARDWDPAEDGLAGPDVPPVKVFVCQAHASIQKSAAILGIGRRSVIDLGRQVDLASSEAGSEQRELKEALARAETLDFDLAQLATALQECQAKAEAAVVVVGMGEVVTGALSDQTLAIRMLCDRFGAWLHMDAGTCMSADWIRLTMRRC